MAGILPTHPDSRQIFHLNLDGGDCKVFPAHSDLAQFVDYYWLLTITAAELELKVIPDTAIDLVLCPSIVEFAALYFPTAQSFTIPLQGPVTYVGTCFRPPAIDRLLGLPLTDLRKLEVGTSTIENLGIASLVTDISHSNDISSHKTSFDQFWLDRLTSFESPTSQHSTLCRADVIKILEDSLGNDSIASVCRSLQISERQFRRLSNELIGLSPKKIQNVLRLQAALSELFDCERQQIHDFFYDDSHRIRELKSLTGLTPQQILHMAEKYNHR